MASLRPIKSARWKTIYDPLRHSRDEKRLSATAQGWIHHDDTTSTTQFVDTIYRIARIEFAELPANRKNGLYCDDIL